MPKYRLKEISGQTDFSETKISYPVFEGSEYKKLNKEIESFVLSSSEKFEEGSRLLAEEYKMYSMELGTKSDFQLDTMAVVQDKNITSVLLSVWYYELGAAHGNFVFKSFNYDSSSQKFIKITDVTDLSLEEISQECRRQLLQEENADHSMVISGTTPYIENFSSFTVEKNRIRIYFDPYAVGPWATGTHEVIIEIK